MRRIRHLLKDVAWGGRPCPDLEERAQCQQRDCVDFEWSLGEVFINTCIDKVV